MISSTARYLDLLFADAGTVELRHLHSDGADSVLCDTPAMLVDEAQRRDKAGSLFTTLNRPAQVEGSRALRDADMVEIVRLPFDFDPVRPAGSSSTDEELERARDASARVQQVLSLLGWPAPLLAMSGNGYHLQYRTALPATPETKYMLRALYRGLAAELSGGLVVFDQTVRNAARIFRLYGTMNRKGPDAAERPHRQSWCRLPPRWERVEFAQVEALASRFTREQPPPRPSVPVVGAGDYTTLDVVAWFQAHGLYEHHVEGNVHAVTCPWEDEHTTAGHNDSIIFEADGGWPGFYCHHAHCKGRGIREVIALFGDATAFCKTAWRRDGEAIREGREAGGVE